jgi:hypothetical protein
MIILHLLLLHLCFLCYVLIHIRWYSPQNRQSSPTVWPTPPPPPLVKVKTLSKNNIFQCISHNLFTSFISIQPNSLPLLTLDFVVVLLFVFVLDSSFSGFFSGSYGSTISLCLQFMSRSPCQSSSFTIWLCILLQLPSSICIKTSYMSYINASLWSWANPKNIRKLKR